MNYISTRGGMAPQRFCDVLLMGLAPDGGLIVPEHYPQVDEAQLARWRHLSYPALAFELLRLYIDDIPDTVLRALVHETYTAERFGSATIVPLKPLSDGISLLQLSQGPTLAFKDIALQLLGTLFDYVLTQRGDHLTIVGATSGDTGSAAEYAMRGKPTLQVFMLSPEGRMSPFQRAQMYSLLDDNIHNLAIQGTFDDCQDLVKAVSHDSVFKATYRVGTVNSINWARILAQVVYYFYGYFRATATNTQSVSFCVPSGNFGNICAAHIARQMGLPIDRLMVATNENDVLAEFFTSGRYRPRQRADTYVTSSPSMDISKASNLERFVFDLVGHDPARVRALWQQVEQGQGFDLSSEACMQDMALRYGFVAGRSTHADRLATIRTVYQHDHYSVDPHTADGIKVARELRRPGEHVVCAETALAVKFAPTLIEALGTPPPCPEHLATLESLPQRVRVLAPDSDALKIVVAETLAQA